MALIILVFAFVFAFLQALNWPAQSRVHLGWLSVSFFILYFIIVGAGFLPRGL